MYIRIYVSSCGLEIDEKLTFEQHFNKIKKKCIDRLNIIKITAHKSWNLSTQTLITLYKSLVGSIFEYPSILQPHLSQKILNSIQIIQNALRTILKKPRETPISILHATGQIPKIQDRLKHLSKLYLINAISNNNPLIINALEEYNRFIGGRENSIPTLFDELKEELNSTLANFKKSNQQATNEEVKRLEEGFTRINS